MSSGGGGGNTTNTVVQKADPWTGVQGYLKDLYSDVGGLQSTPVEYYPGQTWLPMSPLMRMGIESNVGFANNEMPNIYNAGVGGLSDLLGAVDVGNNKYVQDMNKALADQMAYAGQKQIGMGSQELQRGLTAQNYLYDDLIADSQKSFLESVLPGIRNEANMQGGLGGSRQALAEIGAVDQWGNDLARAMRDISQSSGQNYQDYSQSMADMLAQNQMALQQGIAQQNIGSYGQGLNAVGTALGYLPQQMEMGLMPGQVYQQAGNIFEGYQQNALDAAMKQWDYLQNEPWDRLANASSLYSGAAPYKSQSTTSPTPQSSGLANALAMGSAGMGLFNMFM